MPVKPHREVCMSLCESLLYTDSLLYSPNLIIEDVVSSVVVEVGEVPHAEIRSSAWQ
jgi:hypothetical protein